MKHERTTQQGEAITIADLKLHMRVDLNDVLEDQAITSMGKTAARDIEDYAGIALLTQTIVATLDGWPDLAPIALPVGPVQSGATLALVMVIDGIETAINNALYWLEAGKAPRLHLKDGAALPSGYDTAIIKITYQAGYGAATTDIPDDLAHAVADQASRYYDLRGNDELKRHTPSLAPHTARIAQRYRAVVL